MFYNRQRYTLISPLGKLKLDRDPMGWEDTETTIARSEKTYGIFLTISNNLEFTGRAMDYLEDLYNLYGVQAEVQLIKEVKHPKTDEWQMAFKGFLDFTTRTIKNKRFKVEFIEGGLREIFTAQIKEKFELDRVTSISGEDISVVNPDKLTLEGRNIYLLSKLGSDSTTEFEINSGEWNSEGGFREAYRAAPLKILANSDTLNIIEPVESIGTHGQHAEYPIGTSFYFVADRDRGKTKVDINVSFRIKGVNHDEVKAPLPVMGVFLRRYTGGEDFVVDTEFEKELVWVGNPIEQVGATFSGSFKDESFEPKEGDTYALYFWTEGVYGDAVDDGHMNVSIDNYSAYITWEEDSFYERTNSNFLTAFEVGQRLSEIYTGKLAFKSTLFQTGDWKELGFTCGGWLRNLKKETEEGELLEWPLTISWEEYFESLNAIEPVAYGIVNQGNRQYIALERLRYFFQGYTTIRLGQVSNIERTTATELIFSSLATGYKKGGNYEKPLGLDEYNTSSTYITPINKVNTKYERLSPSRADSYAVEQARRLPYELYPDEDTPYDKDNFLIDAKVLLSGLNSTYEVRLWQDDFEQAPTGVYSPETAFNLRLTPAHNRNRHAVFFSSSLIKDPEGKIRYINSEGNSDLMTKLIGEAEVKENEDVTIGDLPKPIFEPEWVEFELPFSQEVMDQIQGTTKINEEEVNNYYGLVEFINERGMKEKGFLFSAKINMKNPMKIKLLKTYQ